jgi:hypothetical protein
VNVGDTPWAVVIALAAAIVGLAALAVRAIRNGR